MIFAPIVLKMKDISVKIIRGLIVLFSKLPLKFHYFMGDVLSWLVKYVVRYRCDLVMVNIARSFPELKYKQVRKVYDDFYRHFGEIFAETIWFGGSDYRRLYDSGIVTVMNPEEISEYYDDAPSMTVLSTHCGNWELMGGFLGYRTATGAKVCFDEEAIKVVYKKLTNEVSDRVFALNRVNALERVGTSCLVESGNILRYTLKHKEDKNVYIYPTDQAPYYKSTPYSIGQFMNQETKAMLGSVGIACKMSHSVMYMKMRRVERGRYEMTLIPICRDASKMTPEEVMRKYYDLLEEEIRETPGNWLWTHNRWKL